MNNYFKIALRSVAKGKAGLLINLFGLSVGITASVFIFLWVQNESTVNGYHPQKAHIYRITHAIGVSENEDWHWETSPMPLAEAAQKNIPGIKNTARVVTNTWGGPVVNIRQKLFAEKTSAWLDASWFDLFAYDFVAGSKEAFTSNTYAIALTESKARKYFGYGNPIGQIVKMDTVNYTVEAVVKDNPDNSSFQFDIMMNMAGRLANTSVLKNDQTWNNFDYITFVLTKPNTDTKQIAQQLRTVVENNRENKNDKISLIGLNDIYFETNLQSSSMPHGNKKAVYVFSILGILLLITACINYVNITTAKASLRAKEVSVRKIIGANKRSLFLQFITESFLISSFAIIVSYLLLQLCLPLFNHITGKTFSLSFSNWQIWKIMLCTLLATTVLNGVYPALLLSSFKPLNVFRGKSLAIVNDGLVRKGLVVFQFALSTFLIVCTITIYKQLQFIQNTNPGYNVSQVMSLKVPYSSIAKLPAEARNSFTKNMAEQLRAQTSIIAASTGGDDIINVESSSSGSADWDGHDTSFNPTIAKLKADTAFLNTFGLTMTEGRWFNGSLQDQHSYILNETAVASLGIQKPYTGQRFTWGSDTGQIIGVVKDFHYKSMHEKIGPMVITGNDFMSSVFIKTKPGHIAEALAATQRVWLSFLPSQPFDYTFLDDGFNQLYAADIRTSQLMLIFSVITIIIAALGLFGLAAFTAEQRVKEVGIRKVLGASVQQITTLLSKDFLLLVLAAIVVATPIAWWAMSQWLQDFAYRIHLGAGIFILSGVAAIIIAFISVSFQSIKAALANPVKSLRSE